MLHVKRENKNENERHRPETKRQKEASSQEANQKSSRWPRAIRQFAFATDDSIALYMRHTDRCSQNLTTC